MRIGVLTSVHPPMDTRIYFKQVRSLARAGHDVCLIARDGGTIDDVDYERLPVPRTRLHRVWTAVQVLQRALALRCDAYHVHDPELLPVAVLLKLRTRAQIVFDVHENVREQIRNKYWIPRIVRRGVASLYRITERACMRWVDHVVLAEDSYAHEYANDPTTIVRNYPMLPPPELAQFPRSYSRIPKLVYCGVVARIRGGLEMIEAAARVRERFPSVQLHIIGPYFPSEFGKEMHACVEELGMQDQVELYGRMPLDRAMQIVARCDIGLAPLHPDPNYLESLPTKMFEYMALGLPVIVSNFPMWKSIVDRADCGLAVNPLEADDIARAVLRIYEDHEIIATLGNNGRKAVLEEYSWEAEARNLLALYPSKTPETSVPRATARDTSRPGSMAATNEQITTKPRVRT